LNAGIALVVTADDFGLGPATSQGIIRAHLEGPVTAAGMMVVTGDRASASAPLLSQAPCLEVGLHLVLTGREKPIGSRRGSGLVGRDGHFLTLPRLLLAALSGRLSRVAVRDEITAQAERFAALVGRPPAYADGHHHVHELPVVREAVIELMESCLLPRVTRTTRLVTGTARARPPTLLRQAVAHSLGSAAARAFRAAGVSSNDRFFGMLDDADWNEPFPWLADLCCLECLPPGCIVEWVVHPGLPDDSWAGRDPYVRRRPMELATLTNPECSGIWKRWRANLTTKSLALERGRTRHG
jgi:predicted glycoside hydrolase/deacetylase ChbG (UPF0249 family)